MPRCNFGLNIIKQSLQAEVFRMKLDAHSQMCIVKERKVRTAAVVSSIRNKGELSICSEGCYMCLNQQ